MLIRRFLFLMCKMGGYIGVSKESGADLGLFVKRGNGKSITHLRRIGAFVFGTT